MSTKEDKNPEVNSIEERPKAPPGKVAIRLNYPIYNIENELVKVLYMPERIKVKHIKKTDQVEGDVEKALFLISSLSNLPMICIDELDAVDIQGGSELGDYIGSFLETAPKTGES